MRIDHTSRVITGFGGACGTLGCIATISVVEVGVSSKSSSIGLEYSWEAVVLLSSMNPLDCGELHVTKSLTARAVLPKRMQNKSNPLCALHCLCGSSDPSSSSVDSMLRKLLDMSSASRFHSVRTPELNKTNALNYNNLKSASCQCYVEFHNSGFRDGLTCEYRELLLIITLQNGITHICVLSMLRCVYKNQHFRIQREASCSLCPVSKFTCS